MAISGSRITHVSRKRIFNCLSFCYSIFATCVFVVILPAYTSFAKFAVFISLLKFYLLNLNTLLVNGNVLI